MSQFILLSWLVLPPRKLRPWLHSVRRIIVGPCLCCACTEPARHRRGWGFPGWFCDFAAQRPRSDAIWNSPQSEIRSRLDRGLTRQRCQSLHSKQGRNTSELHVRSAIRFQHFFAFFRHVLTRSRSVMPILKSDRFVFVAYLFWLALHLHDAYLNKSCGKILAGRNENCEENGPKQTSNQSIRTLPAGCPFVHPVFAVHKLLSVSMQ